MEIGLLAIATSVGTELVTWLNKKFSGTVLQGNGAFILSTVVALLVAFAKMAYSGNLPHFDIRDLLTYFSQVFAGSQLFFNLIYQHIGPTVKQ